MYGLWERFGTLVIAAALLFAALRIHKSSGRHSKVTKPIGVVFAFLAGCALIVTVAGQWMAGFAAGAGALFVAGLIVCTVVIVVDWFADGKPDKFAFWAAFAFAAMVVFGAASLPRVGDQIGNGANRVGNQVQQIGR